MTAAVAEYLAAASRRLWLGALTDAERLECIRRALVTMTAAVIEAKKVIAAGRES